MVLTIKEGLVECATVCVKSVVILGIYDRSMKREICPQQPSYIMRTTILNSDAGTGGARGPLAPSQYLADQLTLFQLGEGRLSPTITTGPPKIFHLPASLLNTPI